MLKIKFFYLEDEQSLRDIHVDSLYQYTASYTENKSFTIIIFTVLRTISLDQIIPFQSHSRVVVWNARA